MEKRKVKESAYIEKAKEHARKQFIYQGTVSEASTTLGSSFIVPFVKAIAQSHISLYVGLLSAFSGLLSPLGNLFGSKLMERESRRTIHVNYTLWSAIIWIPIIAIPFFFWNQIALTWLPVILLVFYSLFVFLSGVKDPASFSWIGDIVSEEDRGHYFARRNRFIGFYALVIFLAAGFVLRVFESRGKFLGALTVLFVLSVVLRMISYYQAKHIFSPHFKVAKKSYFSLWSFLKRFDNFGKFAVFHALFNFAIMVASPFFAVYMLDELGFDTLTFTIVSVSTTAFYLLFTPWAGKFSDKYGNVKLLWIAGFTFPITPLLWLVRSDPLWLIFAPGLVSGIANAALTIGVTNFMYDSVHPQKRGICVAYTSLLNGIGIFLGSLIGGYLLQYLDIGFMKPAFFVFLLAAVLRLLVAVAFLPFIKEERKTDGLKGLSWDVLHPFKTIHSDIVWFKDFVRAK